MNRLILVIFALLVGSQLLSQSLSTYKEIQAYLEEARENSDYEKLADAYYKRAKIQFNADYKNEEVLIDLQQSATYYRYVRDSLGYYKVKMDMAEMYIRSQSFYNDAITNLEESAGYFKRISDFKQLAIAQSLMSKVYAARQDYSQALALNNEAIAINKEVKDKRLEIENGITRANLYEQQGEYKKSVNLIRQYLAKSRKLRDNDLIVKSLLAYGDLQISNRNFEEAIESLTEAEKRVVKGNAQQAHIYELLAMAFMRNLDYKVAFAYQTRYTELIKSLLERSKSTNFQELSIAYETKEKEKEIKILEIEKDIDKDKLEKQKDLNYSLIAAFLAGLVALISFIFFLRQKLKVNTIVADQQDEINKQKIKQLEDDMKIQSLESMVLGQELERKRIATDLHDSLGGMLSTLKLQFDGYQSSRKETVGIAIDSLIDEACGEVRKIARNLKPSALENVGLEAAIIDLINKHKNTNIEINFHSDSEDHVLKYESKLHLYRVVQELVNNAIKHAKPSEITIQLYTQEDEIILMVEDDGKGFDIDTIEKGHGLTNIRSRINILNGDVSVDSSENRGTSIVIHVPLGVNLQTAASIEAESQE